jgi:uncharacterized phage-like protein YoqJ
MKNQICCFTGHRAIPSNMRETIEKRLEEEIENLIHQGVKEFRAGGALGFDTMAALAILKLKKTYPRIRLILVLPHWEQPEGWSEENQRMYATIRIRADEVIYTSWLHSNNCMRKRNRRLVDGSGFCVCYLTKNTGGTVYTVKHAEKKGLRISNLAIPAV